MRLLCIPKGRIQPTSGDLKSGDSFFLLPPPPEFERNPQRIDPAPNGNGLGHYEVLHEVRTIKIRDHRFDAKIIFVSD